MAEHNPTGTFTYDPDGWRFVKTHGKPRPEDYPVVWRTAGKSWGFYEAEVLEGGWATTWYDSMRWVPVTVPPLTQLHPEPQEDHRG